MAITKSNIVMSDIRLYIDITPDAEAPTWSELGDGITNISENVNESGVDAFYLGRRGFGSHTVTALAPTFTLTGHRVLGDEAQDWLFGRKFKLGCKRLTALKVEIYDNCTGGKTREFIVHSCTFGDLQEFSGATEGASDISITLYFNEAPVDVALEPEIKVTGDGTSSVKFTLESATEGALLYYSTDGDEPATAYTSEVTLPSTPGSVTIKAVAKKDGMDESAVVSKAVTVTA